MTGVSELLRGLVRVRSVNPDEAAIAAHVIDVLQRTTAADVHVVETLPGRPSVAAVLGTGSGTRLVLNGHLDTVPVDDETRWTTEPFGGEIRDGRLFGRGACDMKAGLAVQIAVAQALSRERLRGRLVLHFAIGEECAEPGTASLLDAGFVGDVGITGEPTELHVAVATRGLVHARVRLIGRSGHASRPELFVNPIVVLPRVLDEIAELEGELRATTHHPLLPAPSCTPTMLDAGVKENAVPDECVLVFDRRLLPGERIDEALAAIESRVHAVVPSDVGVEVTQMTPGFEPAEIPDTSPFARQLAAIVEDAGGPARDLVGMPYASDVAQLVLEAGIEAVTFGAGSAAQTHCTDEWVSLDQVELATRAVTQLARELLV